MVGNVHLGDFFAKILNTVTVNIMTLNGTILSCSVRSPNGLKVTLH